MRRYDMIHIVQRCEVGNSSEPSLRIPSMRPQNCALRLQLGGP